MTTPRHVPVRRQYERLGVELAAAIRNETAGKWRDAAIYFRRARLATSDPEIREWCAWSARYARLALAHQRRG